MNETLESIRKRRSIRKFKEESVSGESIEDVLKAGKWAPSGKNNQPWRFMVVNDPEIKSQLAKCTRYSKTVEEAPVAILVFLDENSCYDRTKDLQSIGACCQNMLLAAKSLGLGAVWNGEILNHKECLEKTLDIPKNLEIMAIICVGHPAEDPTSDRMPLEKLIVDSGK